MSTRPWSNELNIREYLVWVTCTIFYLYEFLLRTALGNYQYQISTEFGISPYQFTMLNTVFLLTYGVMQIPVGIIIDNIGLKKSVLIGVISCTLSSLCFAYADNYYYAVAWRMMMGFGASFGFLCLLVSIREWMPFHYNGLFIGLSQFIGTMGPILAAGPLESLSQANNISWRIIFTYLGGVGVVISITTLYFVHNNSQKADRNIILYKPEKILIRLCRLFTRFQPWYIAIVSACLYFTLEYLAENEGREFLKCKGINSKSASYIITTSWLGYALGCPVLGAISDILERRKSIIIFSAFIGLAGMFLVLYTEPLWIITSGFLMIGISASGQSVCFAIVAEQFNKNMLAVGYGLTNAMIILTGAISAPLIAIILEFLKSGAIKGIQEYFIAFHILIFIFIIALILGLFAIKETYCKSSINFTILRPVRLCCK